jgi:hypothetical protein
MFNLILILVKYTDDLAGSDNETESIRPVSSRTVKKKAKKKRAARGTGKRLQKKKTTKGTVWAYRKKTEIAKENKQQLIYEPIRTNSKNKKSNKPINIKMN